MIRPASILLVAGCALALAACEKKAASAAAPAATTTAAAPVAAAPAPAATPAATASPAPAAGMGKGGAGAMAGLPKLKVACAADIQKFCAGSSEKPGKCLRPHRAELSPTCAQAWSERRAARMAQHNGAGGAAGAE